MLFLSVIVLASPLGSLSGLVVKDAVSGTVSTQPETDWWPKFHHDPANTGVSTSTAPSMKKILWKYQPDTGGFTSPIVANGSVYVGSLGSPKTSWQGRLSCLDAGTGAVRWTFTPANSSVYADPVYDNGCVFLGTGNWGHLQDYLTDGLGEIDCLDAASGDLIWRYPKSLYVEGGPAVVDGCLYVGGCIQDQGIVLCLDAATGMERWNTTDIIGYIRSPVCIADTHVYVASVTGMIYGLDAGDGRILWNHSTSGPLYCAPTVVSGRLFCGCQASSSGVNGGVYCLNASTGAVIWRTNASELRMVDRSSPAVAADKIYLGTWGRSGAIYCLNADTGAIQWSHSLFGYAHGADASPAVADGKVFVGTNRLLMGGLFLCLNASTGKTQWSCRLPGRVYFSSPAIADGKVYYGLTEGIISNKGVLYCFG